MPVDFPDFFGGIARVAQPSIQKGQFKIVGTVGATIPPNTSATWTVGEPAQDEIWKISRVWACTKQNSLIEVMVEWMNMIISRSINYGEAVIYLPDGLDYKAGNVFKIHVINYANFAADIYLQFAGLMEMII